MQQQPLVVDVAVIGGGLAGLTAAATAAKAGATVAVVDGRSLGGRARSVGRDGFTLNEGAHALYRGAGGWAVLESLGVVPRGVTPSAETYRTVWDGEIARLPAGARSILSSRLLGMRSKLKLAGWFNGIAATAAGLRANGIKVHESDDGMVVEGRSGLVDGGGHVDTHMDHRIAMSFLVMGLAAQKPVTVDDASMIATSFPDFTRLMRGLGARLARQAQ